MSGWHCGCVGKRTSGGSVALCVGQRSVATLKTTSRCSERVACGWNEGMDGWVNRGGDGVDVSGQLMRSVVAAAALQLTRRSR